MLVGEEFTATSVTTLYLIADEYGPRAVAGITQSL